MGVERLRFDKHTELIPSSLNDIAKLLTSNITQDSLKNTTGKYPVFGANSIVGYIDYYHQDKPYSAIIKDGAGVGRTTYNPGKSSVIGTMNYIVPKESVSSIFLFYFLNQINFKKYVIGSTIPHIYFKDYKNVKLKLPNKSEQEKIGNFLSLFDLLIEKLETKIGLLKELKKGYLQQMFPAKGEKVPKIRFKDENGNFYDGHKTDYLKNVAHIKKGKQLSVKNMIEHGEYYVLNGGIEPSGFTNEWNTESDTISISEGGNSCGYVNLNKEKFWSGGHNYTLQEIELSLNYLYSFLKYKQLRIMSLKVGSGLPNIQKKALEKLKIKIPAPKEQKKIGDFFNSLDSMIEKQEKGLNDIEQLKKGYMQRLFAWIK